MGIQRHGTTARYSDVVVHNKVAYIVEVPASLEADIVTQTREVLGGLDHQLKVAGSDKSRLLQATIYLRDMADYDAMNAVWDAWIPPGTAPARACIGARLAKPGFRVEIALTAACR